MVVAAAAHDGDGDELQRQSNGDGDGNAMACGSSVPLCTENTCPDKYNSSAVYPPYPSQIPGPSGVDKIDIRAVTNGYTWAPGGATAGYVMDLGPLLSSPNKNSTYYAFWFVRSCYPLLGCSGVKIAVRGR